jgi:hypothetical protein
MPERPHPDPRDHNPSTRAPRRPSIGECLTLAPTLSRIFRPTASAGSPVESATAGAPVGRLSARRRLL